MTCPCGRELKLLNAASDTPKCVGCGHLPDQCTCSCHCGSRAVWPSESATARVCEDCGYPCAMCDCLTDEELVARGGTVREFPNPGGEGA